MGVGTAVVVILIFFMGMYILGAGSDSFKDVRVSAQEKIAKQNEVPNIEDRKVFEDLANLASDRGTRVCDLKMTFVGSMNDFQVGFGNIPGIENAFLLGEPRLIYHGASMDPLLFPNIPSNTDQFSYQWYCIGTQPTPLDLFRWNLEKNTKFTIEELSLLAFGTSKSDQEVIRVNFIGTSKSDSQKILYTPVQSAKGIISNPFTKSVTLPIGADFPYDFQLEIYLEDVTEDDYEIKFWYDTYPANNKAVGATFTKSLCVPGKSNC